MRRRPRLWALLLAGLASGAALGACASSYTLSTSRCTSLCTTARTCGVIPSSLAGSASDSDAEIHAQCIARCETSSSARSDIKTLIECLDKLMITGDADVCDRRCDDVRQCMQDAVNFGDLGEAALGAATVSVTMVPASFWMSTVESEIWCPKDGGTVPALAAYYDDEQTVSEAQSLLLRTNAGFTALQDGLQAAPDDAGRLSVLAAIDSAVASGELILPPDITPQLRRELNADGWAAAGKDNGDLDAGGCVREYIAQEQNRIFKDVDPYDTASVRARLQREISGGAAYKVFDGGLQICDHNRGYDQNADGSSEQIGDVDVSTSGTTGAEITFEDTGGPIDDTPISYRCEQVTGANKDRCKRFGKPLCRPVDCDGGLAGCDPALCYFDGRPPSRACAELGISEIYLGYESDKTKFLSDQPISCSGAAATVTFDEVTIGLVTPIAVVRGQLPGVVKIPGMEGLHCGVEEPAPLVAGGSSARSSDAFAEPEAGAYCWVIHGQPTLIRAGDSGLIVPSPFVDYVKEAIKPAVRLGLVAARPPVGCDCELIESECETWGKGKCNDGLDNDGDGLADYFSPECAAFYRDTPFYGELATDADDIVGACAAP